MQGKEKHRPAVIEFYRKEGQYAFLSNFYSSPILHNNKIYPTVEHYFQSKKFAGHAVEDMIREAQTPAEAFRLGRNANIPLRADWEDVKLQIMYEALLLKFTQNEQLKQLLLQTGESKLVEHTKNDKFWADGGNGTGQNRLGLLLMQIRRELK